jgi:F0F1-type ATP synthase membrane subunit b/b'
MSKISEVMVLVRTEAETILRDAQAEAEDIRKKALLEAEKTNGLIENFKEKYSAVKAAFTNSLEDMKDMFDSTYDKVGETVKSVEPLPSEWFSKLEEEAEEKANI